ncbi:histidine kinase [Xylanibacillus composti]|nr:histidine kinase [Xylanibacillus composti]
MDDSKYQIYEISESARNEQTSLNKELQQVLDEIASVIGKVDKLEVDFRQARVRLTEVSRDFKRYNEQDIKSAYETATQIQGELIVFREKEVNLKYRRDDLQKRIRNVERTIERAEVVVSQMNVVLEYLSGNLDQVTRILESAKNRQMIGLKIILAQEEERKRIAREIHDGLAQSLANLILRSEIAERLMDKGEYDVVREEVADLKAQVRLGLEEVRKMIFNLRPMALDDLGLVPTLRKFAQDFEEKHHIRTSFEVVGKEARLPSPMEVAIYRFVQEAFSNILKHSGATYVFVELAYEPSWVKILVHDNGKGFNVDLVQAKVPEGSFGLVGMKERVELLEGVFDIQSDSNAGTKLMMSVPVNDEKEGSDPNNGAF